MKWSHNEEWLLTADHSGYVKYWQANMNNVEMYQAHKEPIRGVRYAFVHLDSSYSSDGVYVFTICFFIYSIDGFLQSVPLSDKYEIQHFWYCRFNKNFSNIVVMLFGYILGKILDCLI